MIRHQNKIWRLSTINTCDLRPLLLLITVLFTAYSAETGSPLPPQPLPDPIFGADSLVTGIPDTVDSILDAKGSVSAPDSTGTLRDSASLPAKPSVMTPDTSDTSKLDTGGYWGAGFGWSLGGFEFMRLWENALPASLADIGLTDSAFRVLADTTNGTSQLADTARLVFGIKEKPTVYTMCFPLSISYINITPSTRTSFSLTGSWMHKLLTATVNLNGNTVSGAVDYRQNVHCYSLFVSALYGREVDPRYLSIDGLEKCFLSAGIDASPFFASRISIDTKAPDRSNRLQKIQAEIIDDDRFIRGYAGALRFGINMMQRISRRKATDAAFFYTFQGYGYFFENGRRTVFGDIDPSSRKNNRPLFWLSNRFEISITLLNIKPTK